jgi:hypothetical protein
MNKTNLQTYNLLVVEYTQASALAYVPIVVFAFSFVHCNQLFVDMRQLIVQRNARQLSVCTFDQDARKAENNNKVIITNNKIQTHTFIRAAAKRCIYCAAKCALRSSFRCANATYNGLPFNIVPFISVNAFVACSGSV